MADAGIQLIVGLGNPGAEYAATRHNAGFWLVERIAAAHGGSFRHETRLHGQVCRVTIAGHEVRLFKPTTFMNRSGQAVAAITHYFSIPIMRVLLAYDELDVPAGQVRLKRGGGHAGHNGVRDTIAMLTTADFWRLRIGIAHPGDKRRVVNYVLHAPAAEEAQAIDAVLTRAVQQVPALLTGQFQQVMNQLHCTATND